MTPRQIARKIDAQKLPNVTTPRSDASALRGHHAGDTPLGFAVSRAPDFAGWRVAAVMEGGPAAAAGLRAEDVLQRVNGREVGRLDFDALVARLEAASAEDGIRSLDVARVRPVGSGGTLGVFFGAIVPRIRVMLILPRIR